MSHRDAAVRTNRRTSLHALYKGLSNCKKGLSYSPWTFQLGVLSLIVVTGSEWYAWEISPLSKTDTPLPQGDKQTGPSKVMSESFGMLQASERKSDGVMRIWSYQGVRYPGGKLSALIPPGEEAIKLSVETYLSLWRHNTIYLHHLGLFLLIVQTSLEEIVTNFPDRIRQNHERSNGKCART